MTGAEPESPAGSVPRRSWAIWLAGSSVYMLAVFNRSTLAIAGPDAISRFQISAAQLGVFITVQVAVYAAMQIPSGLLADRFGPRRMLLAAALVMGIGQAGFALLPSYPLALVARAVLGCGDALTYVSVLRLIAAWFPKRKYAILASFSGFFGIAGSVLATVPLAAVLPVWGWSPTFGLAAGLCGLYAAALIRPGRVPAPYREPEAPVAAPPLGVRGMLRQVRHTHAAPASHLAFWVHFASMTGPMMFGMLWGFPYLTEGLGYTRGLASSLLLIMVLVQLGISVLVGWLTGRRPGTRLWLAFVGSTTNALALTGLIAWPGGHPPLPVVVTLIAVLSFGVPASSVAFLLARDYNPRSRMATATGIANTGGWAATLVQVLAVGIIIDLVEPDVHTTTGYRWAFAAVLAMGLVALWRLLVWLVRTRATVFALQEAGEQVPVTVRPRVIDRLPWGAA